MFWISSPVTALFDAALLVSGVGIADSLRPVGLSPAEGVLSVSGVEQSVVGVVEEGSVQEVDVGVVVSYPSVQDGVGVEQEDGVEDDVQGVVEQEGDVSVVEGHGVPVLVEYPDVEVDV